MSCRNVMNLLYRIISILTIDIVPHESLKRCLPMGLDCLYLSPSRSSNTPNVQHSCSPFPNQKVTPNENPVHYFFSEVKTSNSNIQKKRRTQDFNPSYSLEEEEDKKGP